MKKSKVKKKEKLINGKVYHIEFLDHCLCGGEVEIKKIYCETFGRVLAQDDDVLLMTFWDLPSHDMKTSVNNQERRLIIKSTIRNYQEIGEFTKRTEEDLSLDLENR